MVTVVDEWIFVPNIGIFDRRMYIYKKNEIEGIDSSETETYEQNEVKTL